MGAHLIEGEFQSDKYPTTPRGKVPLSVKDKAAQPLLWRYAELHRAIDAEFSDDLQQALRLAGFDPAAAGLEAKVIDRLVALTYAAYCALDDSEEQEDGSLILDADNARKLCAALDAVDELPDDQPGYTMGPAAKAKWALRALTGILLSLGTVRALAPKKALPPAGAGDGA